MKIHLSNDVIQKRIMVWAIDYEAGDTIHLVFRRSPGLFANPDDLTFFIGDEAVCGETFPKIVYCYSGLIPYLRSPKMCKKCLEEFHKITSDSTPRRLYMSDKKRIDK